MNRKNIIKSVLCFSLVVILAFGGITNVLALNNQETKVKNKKNLNNFTTEVSNYDKKYIDDVDNSLPAIKAYEVDLSGNKKQVIPISQQVLKSKSKIITAVPNDGFIYIFDDYDLDYSEVDKYFKKIGSVNFENRSSNLTWDLKYTQSSANTVKWSVSVNISGKTEIGNKFLGKIEAAAGLTVSREKTYAESTIVENTLEIQPGNWGMISKYQYGRSGNGRLVYKKYSPDGISWIGMYYETAGGWAISPTEITWVLDGGSL